VIDTTWSKLWFFLHIASVVVAFAPGIVAPLLVQAYRSSDGAQKLAGVLLRNDKRVHGPALVAAGLFGIFLILASHELVKFDDSWVSMAFVVWIAMNGVLHGLIAPGLRGMAAGDADAERRWQLGGAIIDLLFLVMLVLMIWKPGS
jgi:uncharacterized membrane protein